MKTDKTAKLALSRKEMQDFGYKVVDAIVDHFETQDQKLPVATASRKEIDALFMEEIPEKPMAPDDVLNFVLEQLIRLCVFLLNFTAAYLLLGLCLRYPLQL